MRLRDSTFGYKMTLVTGTLAVLVLLLVGYGLHVNNRLHNRVEEMVTGTVRRVKLAVSIDAISDMSMAQRGDVHFKFAKEESKDRFRRDREMLIAALAELRPIMEVPESRQLVAQIDLLLPLWSAAYTEMEALIDTGRLDDANRFMLDRVIPKSVAIAGLTDRLIVLEESLLESDRKMAQDAWSSARWMTIVLVSAIAAAVIGAIAVVRSATREIRRAAVEMRRGSQEVDGASEQVAAASQSLAQDTSEQAATLRQASASAGEITAVTRKNAEITRTVAGFMTETSGVVENANVNLKAMVDSMEEINGSSRHISKIIRVIDEIAFQTSILALNAAVEAARAGDAGVGFAVVAEEVRNLAQRSAQAAKDTAALVEESISKTGEGSRRLDQMAKSIQQITASAMQIKTLVDEIDLGSQEQARGIEQIAAAVGQMEQVTERASANAGQSAAAGEELAAQAMSLRESSGRLRAMVGGDAGEFSRTDPMAPRPVGQRRNRPEARRRRASFPLDETER